MNKIISLTSLILILLGTTCFASNKDLKIIEKQDTVVIDKVEDYKESINDELTIENVDYTLESIDKKENKKLFAKDKEITEELIVTTNDKYNILNMFETKINIAENGFVGILELQNDSLEVKVNDSYQEEYKVYLQKTYTNVKSNELNNIPKEIKEDGVIYYLINPVWDISTTEKIGDNDVPLDYNGTMYYEGIKVRTIIKNYKATVSYIGTLEKEVVESVTFNVKYEELPKEADYTVPVIATTSGIIIFSGIVLLKRKNAKVYSCKKDEFRLVKKLHISRSNTLIDITSLGICANKYKIVLSNSIYKALKNRNIKIKYFDKQFTYLIKDKEFEILV